MIITLIVLLYQFLKEYQDIDVIDKLNSGGPRCIHWLGLLLTCLVVISSSVVKFTSSKCRSDNPVIPLEAMKTYQPNMSMVLFCQRSALGVGIGTAVAFVSIMILCELLYVEDYEKEVLLQSEMLFSVTSSIALAWSAFLITGQRGCAPVVGNLFYSIWISFVISSMIVCSCVADLEERALKRKLAKRGIQSRSISNNA